jgi:hypothetical protein
MVMMDSLFSFKKHATPILVKAIFWTYVCLSALGYVVLSFQLAEGNGGGMLVALMFLLIPYVIGIVVAKITAEVTLILFDIHDQLRQIKTLQTNAH